MAAFLVRLSGRQFWRTSYRTSCRWASSTTDAAEKDALMRQELAKRAHREVQVSRRRRREAEDELVLYQSATAAGFSESASSSEEDEVHRKRRVITRFLTAQAENVMDAITSKKPLSSVVDFTLEVAPSIELPQPIAGQGVFIKDAVRDEVPPGTLLTFYPGTVYMPHEVRWLGGFGPTLKRAGQHTTTHVIGRVGGVRIDGLWSSLEVPAAEFTLDDAAIEAAVRRLEAEYDTTLDAEGRQQAYSDARAFCADLGGPERRGDAGVLIPDHGGDVERLRGQNPLAVGEMVNHPPDGRSANVVGWPIDLNLFGSKGEDRSAYARAAPNTYALRSAGASAPGPPCPYTVAFVAATTLKPGDELYLDYGCELLPVEDIPVWFAPASLRGNRDEYDPATAPAAAIQAELQEWRATFEKQHHRRPTRHDMLGDPMSAALFETFQKYRKLGDL
eukprot:TRINITY_DN21531_c0_g1_i1.p1 TRINITY_DN21531_c0_g1~~TRINITY_DN21531_c0_g1_i1.p1  ORF type:complete len:447 (+),score=68.95 TRINITY_DN21531_c0_g1_i1:80-1420(+)